MDIILLIIAICFRCSDENHNYTALTVLSVIGLIVCAIMMIASSWVFVCDVILYIIVLLICALANNKE